MRIMSVEIAVSYSSKVTARPPLTRFEQPAGDIDEDCNRFLDGDAVGTNQLREIILYSVEAPRNVRLGIPAKDDR